MKNKILKIESIKIMSKFYARESINKNLVAQYVKAMNDGDIFPDIIVAEFKGNNILMDGYHRLVANKERGEKYMKCEILNNFPDMDSIYMSAVKSNLKHGLRYSTEDKKKIALRLREMKFEIEDISKLLHIKVDVISKIRVSELQKVIYDNKKRKGVFKEKLRDVKPDSEIIPIVNSIISQIEYLKDVNNFLREKSLKVKDKEIILQLKRIQKRCYTLLLRKKS